MTDLVERVAARMFDSEQPVFRSDEEAPPSLIALLPEGADPDDVYEMPIPWAIWRNNEWTLDYDSIAEFRAETIIRMARAAIAEVRRFDVEQENSRKHAEKVVK